MMIYEILIMLSLLLGSALVSTTIWTRTQTRLRLMAMVMFVAMLPLLAGSGFMALGHPAPWVQMLTVPEGEHLVLGVRFIQDEAIYLWLDFKEEDAPRSFYLPWSDSEAKRIQDMIEREKATGRRVVVGTLTPTESQPDGGRMYYLEPQPRMPDKIVPSALPSIYDRTP